MTFTIHPTTAENEDVQRFGREHAFLVDDVIEAEIVAICRDNDWNGAHVFAGANGAVFSEGRDANYCGWIDARENAELEAA